MKKGFTLVELSIVLVIIGLLIGGILVGQSLMNSARINSIIKEEQQFNIAIVNFKQRYKYWPGDYPGRDFGVSFGNGFQKYGNGDGWLSRLVNPPATNETISSWYQLTASKMLNLDLPFTAGITFDSASWVPRNNEPGSVYNKKAIYAFGGYGEIPHAWPGEAAIGLYGDTDTSSPYPEWHGIVKPVDATAIDQKIDDGIVGTGNVRAASNYIAPYNCGNLNYDKEEDGCRIYFKLVNF